LSFSFSSCILLAQQQCRLLHPLTLVQIGEINAFRRDADGSKHAQAMRQQHLIPGIIYGFDEDGKEEVQLVAVQEKELRREVNKRGDCFYNTLFDM